MLFQFQWAARNAASTQILRAGADDARHRRQRRGHQAAVGQGADTHDDIHLTQVFALQVDEAVDQA